MSKKLSVGEAAEIFRMAAGILQAVDHEIEPDRETLKRLGFSEEEIEEIGTSLEQG
jgi:Holliday junction resolvasome RuvABC DNA-binding subunit